MHALFSLNLSADNRGEGRHYHDIHLENNVACYAPSCSHGARCVHDLNFIIIIIIMRKFQRNSWATKRIDNKQKSLSFFGKGPFSCL